MPDVPARRSKNWRVTILRSQRLGLGVRLRWAVEVRRGGRGTYMAGWRMRLTRTRRLAMERL